MTTRYWDGSLPVERSAAAALPPGPGPEAEARGMASQSLEHSAEAASSVVAMKKS